MKTVELTKIDRLGCIIGQLGRALNYVTNAYDWTLGTNEELSVNLNHAITCIELAQAGVTNIKIDLEKEEGCAE